MSGRKSVIERLNDKIQEEFRDLEIERQLTAYLVRSNPSGCGVVRREWLTDYVLPDVFIVVNDLGITLSKAMLINELRKRGMIGKEERDIYEDAVDELFAIDVSGFNEKNTRHMAEQLQELSESRKVTKLCSETAESIIKQTFDLSDAKRKFAALSRPVGLVDHEHIGLYLDDYGRRAEIQEEKQKTADEHEEAEAGILTGIRRFDSWTGGIMRKEFGVVAGMPGVGKTAALINFGLHAWQKGYDVMMVSGEMSKDDVGFRIDSYLTRIPGMKFRTAKLDEDDYKKWGHTINIYQTTQENFLCVAAYPRGFTLDHVERDMTWVQEETGRKTAMVCADYINIMDPVRRSGSNWEDQKGAIWDFKDFIAEYNLVGWTAGQVKDEAFEKEVYDLQDLKYARAISECAPIVIALIQTEKDIVDERMKLQILKMRNAKLSVRPIALTPCFDIMRLDEDKREIKTLRGRQPDTLDVKGKAKTARPRKKSLHGR